jgi:hypothetical protein
LICVDVWHTIDRATIKTLYVLNRVRERHRGIISPFHTLERREPMEYSTRKGGKRKERKKQREKGKHGSQTVQWEYMASGLAELSYTKVVSTPCET